MKKVMKFVKGKKEEENPREASVAQTKKLSIDKSDDSFKDDDFILRDKSVTKLHKAVWYENSDKLKNIIKTIDIDITDRLDRTALYLAILKNNPNIVNLLLENSANQNIPDLDGITPFLKSIKLGHKDCAEILLNYGADLKKTDKDSNTCIHYAVLGNHEEILSFLLECNADCSIFNNNGESPLSIAIKSENIPMIELLLKYKADKNLVNSGGLSAVMVAEQQGNLEIISLLEKPNNMINKTLSVPPVPTEDLSLKSSYENLKLEKYLTKTDSDTTDNTWNDSPISTPTKLTKIEQKNKPVNTTKHFFNEDPENGEENSETDASKKCSENTSPQSGIIPPPCKPLRSLEYLQSGISTESRPIQLLTLGTVRTRHISMTESDPSRNNTPQRYSYQGDFQLPIVEDSYKLTDDRGDSVKSSKLLSKLECDSTIQSDWGSNESLPLDELSFLKDKSNSNSSSIKDHKITTTATSTNDPFLQKQFSILEDYEKNCEKRCCTYELDLLKQQQHHPHHHHHHHQQQHQRQQSESSQFDVEDLDNLLEDNNRINSHLEKYALPHEHQQQQQQQQQHNSPKYYYYYTTTSGTSNSNSNNSKKSKSLPRYCDSYNSYHKGSYSLPRTLEPGKDPFRDMRNYGPFKPRSHFFSLKMLKGDKKNTFLDKLKCMFNKKSQIHLTDHESNNGTWLYKEKYKIKTDSDFYSSKLDTFSTSESSSSRKSHHSDFIDELKPGSGLHQQQQQQHSQQSDEENDLIHQLASSHTK